MHGACQRTWYHSSAPKYAVPCSASRAAFVLPTCAASAQPWLHSFRPRLANSFQCNCNAESATTYWQLLGVNLPLPARNRT